MLPKAFLGPQWFLPMGWKALQCNLHCTNLFLRYLCIQKWSISRESSPPHCRTSDIPVSSSSLHPVLPQGHENHDSCRVWTLGPIPRSVWLKSQCLRYPGAVGTTDVIWKAQGPSWVSARDTILTGSSLCCCRGAAHGPRSTQCSRTDSHHHHTCRTAQETGPGGQGEMSMKSETRDHQAPFPC